MAKAMSVAAGMAQPGQGGISADDCQVDDRRDTTIPAAAATIGSRRSEGVDSWPSYHSRFTSSPTRRKKIAISPSATQWCTSSWPRRGRLGPTFQCSMAS